MSEMPNKRQVNTDTCLGITPPYIQPCRPCKQNKHLLQRFHCSNSSVSNIHSLGGGIWELPAVTWSSMSLPQWAAVSYMFTCFVSGVPAAAATHLVFLTCCWSEPWTFVSESDLSHRQGSLSAFSCLATISLPALLRTLTVGRSGAQVIFF